MSGELHGAFESQLRALIVEIVRDEVRQSVAQLTRPDEYLSMRAASTFVQVAPGTLRRWIREGQLEPHGAGRHLRVKRVDLERLLKRGGRRWLAAMRSPDETPEERARRLVARRFGPATPA